MRTRGPIGGRRGLLLAGGVLAGASGAGAQLMQEPPGRDEAAARHAETFYSRHQPGIVTPPPAAGLVAAFDVLAPSRAELERLFRVLTSRIAFLMAGGTPPETDPRFPPPDSGILGPKIVPDGLTITVGVGASLFDERFGLAARRPAELETMRRFPNDALDRAWVHGDLLVQICANVPMAALHALRDLIKHTPDLLRLRWKLDGFLPPHAAGAKPETPRNLLGFKDGTANIDPKDERLLDQLIWVQPGGAEPAWTAGGTYMAVRIIRNLVERWDRTPLQEQEAIMGRAKASGAPLGRAKEHDDPDYASDPDGKRIPHDAHIRLANPHTPEAMRTRILRRPYNYSRGVTRAGQLDMGLIFICFQRSLREGFIAIQERLNGEPLEEYIKPVGGGYFFVLPGVTGPDRFLGQELLAA